MKGLIGVFLCVAIVSLIVLSPSLALAQGGSGSSPAVIEVEPLVDFSGVFDSLTTVVTAVIVGAVTIGLSIWGTRFVFGIVKSMGRG